MLHLNSRNLLLLPPKQKPAIGPVSLLAPREAGQVRYPASDQLRPLGSAPPSLLRLSAIESSTHRIASHGRDIILLDRGIPGWSPLQSASTRVLADFHSITGLNPESMNPFRETSADRGINIST